MSVCLSQECAAMARLFVEYQELYRTEYYKNKSQTHVLEVFGSDHCSVAKNSLIYVKPPRNHQKTKIVFIVLLTLT